MTKSTFKKVHSAAPQRTRSVLGKLTVVYLAFVESFVHEYGLILYENNRQWE
ncbi:hypothetical protein BTS2_0866 [Bacillus sp. TS-2]|nr:hypothetical protein BTS2_0866 [Bacillus sp. TS-2]